MDIIHMIIMSGSFKKGQLFVVEEGPEYHRRLGFALTRCTVDSDLPIIAAPTK
jgi:hypothetical protein